MFSKEWEHDGNLMRIEKSFGKYQPVALCILLVLHLANYQVHKLYANLSSQKTLSHHLWKYLTHHMVGVIQVHCFFLLKNVTFSKTTYFSKNICYQIDDPCMKLASWTLQNFDGYTKSLKRSPPNRPFFDVHHSNMRGRSDGCLLACIQAEQHTHSNWKFVGSKEHRHRGSMNLLLIIGLQDTLQ